MSLREGEDAFRVVEFGSWAQIRALRLRGHALAASFFADSESVYVETEPVLGGGRVETQRVRLDLGTGKDEQRIDPYSQQDAHTSYQAIQRTTLLGILDDVKSHMTEFLVRAELPSYRELQRVPFAEARDSAIGKTETPLAVSIDRATFAYSVDHTIVCRRTADLTSKWSQRVDPDVPLWHVAVSASGNFVGASMSGDATAAQRKGSCVAIYSGEDGRLVTQLPVSTQEPFAISPDGRLVAVGQRVNMPGKPSGTQPTVLIFDTDSARITSTLVQDQFRAGGREFLYAGFGRLEFTPDGKYLVTSGLNTKVWKIG